MSSTDVLLQDKSMLNDRNSVVTYLTQSTPTLKQDSPL